MKINNKKRQEPLFKQQVIVDYFRQPPNKIEFWADDMPYLILGNKRIFGKYKVVKATKMYDPSNNKSWYAWNKCKVVKI